MTDRSVLGQGCRQEKNSRGRQRKKDRKTALLSHFREVGATEKKRPKNGTFKPLSTITVPCMKIQALPPTADAHVSGIYKL